MNKAFAVVVAACAALLGSSAIAAAQTNSGVAVAVDRTAQASGKGGSRTLEINGPVFMGDVIATDASGIAQIRFVDQTKMVVGPNSSVTVDRFVLAKTGSATQITINATRGAFRFITGTSNKQSYTINTPSATIGVRGTEFDVTIEGNATNLALYEGGVRICDRGVPDRRCTELEGACQVIVYAPQRGFEWIDNVYQRTAMMDTIFPFALKQQPLQADFRVQSSGCDIRDLTPPAPALGGDDQPVSEGQDVR